MKDLVKILLGIVVLGVLVGISVYFYNNTIGKEESNTNLAEVIIGKHRNGRTGTINLVFKGDTCSFLNYAKEEG